MEVRSVVLTRSIGKTEIPQADNFSVRDCYEKLELQDGEVLVKTLFLSVDPYMRYRMLADTGTYYLEAWKAGQPCDGGGVGVVVQTKYDGLNEGDFVQSFLWPWKTTCKIEGKLLNKVSIVISR